MRNPCQGNYPRWLFVCSAGMLRSATAAHHFAGRNVNTRCAGTDESAIQPIHQNTLMWADEIFVMEQEHLDKINSRFDTRNMIIHVLGIPDRFNYRDVELIKLIEEKVYGSK